nr:dynein light chain 1, axonemal-like [Halyomorpha halys]
MGFSQQCYVDEMLIEEYVKIFSVGIKLSLSTNMIEKISGLSGLRNLKILSLARNYIKSFSGLEAVGDSLEQLWISYNFIDKTKGIGTLRNLKVLYMSNNLIKEWSEFQKLQECQELKELTFMGNPLCESYEESGWRLEATRKLPQLEKLDGEPVINEMNSPSNIYNNLGK